MKKLISIDLDGTLMNENHDINELNIFWIRMAMANGYDVLINTGRGSKYIDELFKRKMPIMHQRLLYSAKNGSTIYRWVDGEKEILKDVFFDGDSIKDIEKVCKEHKVLMHFNDDYFIYGQARLRKLLVNKIKGEIKPEIDYPTYKKLKKVQLISVSKKKIVEITEILSKQFTEQNIATSFNGHALEITSKEANKGLTIEFLKEKFGYERVVSFGDSGNDYSAFKVSDFGYAPHNKTDALDLTGIESEILDNSYFDFVSVGIRKELKMDNMIVTAHRGGNVGVTENTREAFAKSIAFVDELKKVNSNMFFETDVRLTKDEELLVYHDEDFSRLSNIEGKINDYTLEEIRALDHPGTLITFQELVNEFDAKLIYVEIKDSGDLGKVATEKMLNFIKENDLENRVEVTAEKPETSDYIYETAKKMNVALLTCSNYREAKTAILKFKFGIGTINKRADTIDLPIKIKSGVKFNLLTKSVVNKSRKHGYLLSFWDWVEFPIKDSDIQKMIDLGVPTVMIDDVEKVVNKLTSK